jgi:hypothetical protein
MANLSSVGGRKPGECESSKCENYQDLRDDRILRLQHIEVMKTMDKGRITVRIRGVREHC